jgi:hypothetical protein
MAREGNACRFTVFGHRNAVALILENFAHQITDVRLVIDDKYV